MAKKIIRKLALLSGILIAGFGVFCFGYYMGKENYMARGLSVYVRKEDGKTSNCFVVTSRKENTLFQIGNAQSIYNLEQDPYFQMLLKQQENERKREEGLIKVMNK